MQEIIPALYIVGTPIGNISDVTDRQKYILQNVDCIACEDTRELKKLLSLLKIDFAGRRFVSVHEHNEREVSTDVLNEIKLGKSFAYVSDAGMPAISDPGSYMIDLAHDQEIKVVPIPGPTALTTAFSVAGFHGEFCFAGFFPRTAKDQKVVLKDLAVAKEVFIFYESPKRVRDTIKLIDEAIGGRRIVLCRELTKKFEQIIRGTAAEVLEQLVSDPKGECVLVVEAKVSQEEQKMITVQAVVSSLKSRGFSRRDVVEMISSISELNNNEIKEIYEHSI